MIKFEELTLEDIDKFYNFMVNTFDIKINYEKYKYKVINLLKEGNFKILELKQEQIILASDVIYIHYDPFQDMSFATLWYFGVKKDMRGKGLGSILLDNTKEYLKKQNIVSIRLTTQKTNIACQKASEKSGFEQKFAYKISLV